MAPSKVDFEIVCQSRELRHVLGLIEAAAYEHEVHVADDDLPSPAYTLSGGALERSPDGRRRLVVDLIPNPALYTLLGAIKADALEAYRASRRPVNAEPVLSDWDAWWRIRHPSPPSTDQQSPVGTPPASGPLGSQDTPR